MKKGNPWIKWVALTFFLIIREILGCFGCHKCLGMVMIGVLMMELCRFRFHFPLPKHSVVMTCLLFLTFEATSLCMYWVHDKLAGYIMDIVNIVQPYLVVASVMALIKRDERTKRRAILTIILSVVPYSFHSLLQDADLYSYVLWNRHGSELKQEAAAIMAGALPPDHHVEGWHKLPKGDMKNGCVEVGNYDDKATLLFVTISGYFFGREGFLYVASDKEFSTRYKDIKARKIENHWYFLTHHILGIP